MAKGAFIQNEKLGWALSAVMLLVAFYLMMPSFGNKRAKPGSEQAWYMDLKTGQLFKAPAATYPPIDAPSGKDQGARAYVYSCDECSTTFVGYLEKYTETFKALLNAPESLDKDPVKDVGIAMIEQNHLISAPDGKNWLIWNSTEGEALQVAAATKCPSKIRECHPKP